MSKVSWPLFKEYVDSKSLSIQYVDDNPLLYSLCAVDGNLTYVCNVLKTDPANDDQIDFETNYSNLTNSKLPTRVNANQISSWSPDPSSYPVGASDLLLDISGNLMTRSQTFTDAFSFRDEFSTSLTSALTGTVTFTNGSDVVTGVDTSFTSELKIGMYVKNSIDPSSELCQISSVDSDTELTLGEPYSGTSGSGAATSCNWSYRNGTGTTYCSSSILTLESGTGLNDKVCLYRRGDYQPINLIFKMKLSQRISNQETLVGLVRNKFSDIQQQVVIVFDGVDNTKVKFRSSSSTEPNDIQETSITLPYGWTTDDYHKYEVDVTAHNVTLLVDRIIVAVHYDHIPGPYDSMGFGAVITNTGAVSNTLLNIDYMYFGNHDVVHTQNQFMGELDRVQLVGRNSTTNLPIELSVDLNGNLIVSPVTKSGSGLVFGDVATTVSVQTAIRKTAYVEQTTDGAFTVVSSSLLDITGGTGATEVTIYYLDQNGSGPYTTSINLNGITPVTTSVSNICYIEKLIVTSVGSLGANQGTITLKTLGGLSIASINANDNQTSWCHHYIPSGLTANITGISISHNGTTASSGGTFVIKSKPLSSTKPEIQISDYTRLYGQSSGYSKDYNSAIRVEGPARITAYVTPESGASLNFRAAIDFYE